MAFDIVNEPLLIVAHPEKIVGLLNSIDFFPALRAVAVDEILFGEKSFATDAVPAFVLGAVDFVAIKQILQNLLHNCFVARLRRANKIVVRNFQPFPKLLKTDDGLVALFLRADPVFFGRLLNLLPVLVGAGQKKGGRSEQTVIVRQHIRQNRRVRMADMRLIVHIIDRSRYVIVFIHRRQRI